MIRTRLHIGDPSRTSHWSYGLVMWVGVSTEAARMHVQSVRSCHLQRGDYALYHPQTRLCIGRIVNVDQVYYRGMHHVVAHVLAEPHLEGLELVRGEPLRESRLPRGLYRV